MKTRAVIIKESPGTFEVAELDLDEPRQGEIQVKMVAAGLCHSDEHQQTGDQLAGTYPWIIGHEGAGIVEVVGPDTPNWEVGDHVIFSFIPSCGHCRWCSEGMTNLCDLGKYIFPGSRFTDDSFRNRLDGVDVGQSCSIGAFSERVVVSVDSAIKVDKDLPLESMPSSACAVGTGWGSAVYSAEVKVGDVVIVMGVGGVGSNAIQGARHAGATTIIAVDPVEFKRETALSLGATHAFDSMPEADAYAKSITNGQGADKAIITTSVVHGEYVAEAFAAIRKAGTVVVTGITPKDEFGLPISIVELTLMQKRLQGSLFGACNPRSDVPRQIQMYRNGQLKLDELITRRYKLDEILVATDDLNAGRIIRGVIVFD